MSLGSPVRAPVDDEALVAWFEQGDDHAFGAIYERYNARITTYARRMLGRREDAEEVCTEVFVRLVERRWRPVGTVRNFLFTVAHRICVDRLRSRARRARLSAWFGLGAPSAATHEEQLVSDERDRSLHAAIDALAHDHRSVVLLTYTEGLRSAEVAEILGCTDQQVRSKLAYARRLLRERMEGIDG